MMIEEYLHTDKLFFAPSASMCLFSVLYPLREETLGIPDQGYFKGILQIADLLNIDYTLIKTERGLIIPENIENVDTFIFSSFSGHVVENDVNEICSHCQKNNILPIEDISSGFSYPPFGKGEIVVCSTGTPKILECGWGGFAAYRNGTPSEVFRYMSVPEGYREQLKREVENAEEKVQRVLNYSKILKEFSFESFFRDKAGLSVFVRTDRPKKFLKVLNKKITPDIGRSLFTQCPRFDRVLEKGFVIETIKVWKRDEDEIREIGRTIEKVMQCSNM
jgi:hypothetical protein